jgi:hypothetical protein
MEVTAAVLYGGALAHYDVNIENRGICTARLTEYKGNPQQAPPAQLTLMKEGRQWVSNEADRNLSSDIGYAVEIKVPKELVTLGLRRRESGDPAA